MKKRAIISVSNKEGALELAKGLVSMGYEIVSTGGTAQLLSDNNVPVTLVEDVTGSPECLGGRVKTLHPRVFAGLLAIVGDAEHEQTLAEMGIPPVDILVSNLYPFVETIGKSGHTLEEAIENIDIGGPSMIRAAAKNYKSVAVITDPSQYSELMKRVESGTCDEGYRFDLAASAFTYTADYDTHISGYLCGVTNKKTPEKTGMTNEHSKFIDVNNCPDELNLVYKKHTALRYGENPQQGAAYYIMEGVNTAHGVESATFLHGKELSYNNISDTQAAISLIKEFIEPACAAIKHGTPCGVGTGANTHEAYMGAYECDPTSIFGGIISFNKNVDAPTATKMSKLFLEVIVAPAYDEDALVILKKKKNLRILEMPDISAAPGHGFEIKSAGGGLLVQGLDLNDINEEGHSVVTKAIPSESEIKDMVFGMKVARHVKSNAIVVVKDGRTLGIGGGQVRRSWAAEHAINNALFPLKGAVLASDALFPMPDVVELCHKAGITSIIQPGGSINDAASIEACDKWGIAMVFTGVRHFKH